MQGFTTAQTAQLTGLNPKTLHYWATSGFLSPSVQQSRGTGTRRLYSFHNLLSLRVARELRAAGLSLQALRRVVKYLRKVKQIEKPMAELFLVTDGKEVYFRDGDGLVGALRQPGQGVLFQVIDLTRTVTELNEYVLRLQETPEGEEKRKSTWAG
jgi:DNA-binding transcriptional MerR regulator